MLSLRKIGRWRSGLCVFLECGAVAAHIRKVGLVPYTTPLVFEADDSLSLQEGMGG